MLAYYTGLPSGLRRSTVGLSIAGVRLRRRSAMGLLSIAAITIRTWAVALVGGRTVLLTVLTLLSVLVIGRLAVAVLTLLVVLLAVLVMLLALGVVGTAVSCFPPVTLLWRGAVG